MLSSLSTLLERASPSIQYRLRREVLGQSAQSPRMCELQSSILSDAAVQEVLSWQQADGWLAWNFHGDRSLESGLRLLLEKGVEPDHPTIRRALQATLDYPDRLARGISKVGDILDDQGLGGSQLIRAALFAQAGREGEPCVQEQIERSLAGFRSVLQIASVADLAVEYRGKLVFKPGAFWPSIYHLRLLAFTNGWREAENCILVRAVVERMVRLSPIPPIYTRHKSQLIAPASFAMQDFQASLPDLDSVRWMLWLHRMELLSRLGVLPGIPALAQQRDQLQAMLAQADGRFTLPISHPYFRKWGAYTGMMLEPDWRDPRRRENDLTFRSLLLLHFSNR